MLFMSSQFCVYSFVCNYLYVLGTLLCVYGRAYRPYGPTLLHVHLLSQQCGTADSAVRAEGFRGHERYEEKVSGDKETVASPVSLYLLASSDSDLCFCT